MKMQVNKKLLQDKLQKETGKIVLLKDLSNIALQYKGPTKSFQEIVKKLEDDYQCCVNLLHNNNVLQGLFFQDTKMKQAYSYFPEILFLDGTYKLIDIRFGCYIFVIEDGNGNSEICGVGLLGREDTSSFEWLIQVFQQRNDCWRNTKSIMTDKDIVSRKILSQKFPTAKLLLCKFHVLRAFKREVTTEKMKITQDEVNIAKDLFAKMCYSLTADEYFQTYEIFKNSVNKKIVDYFDKNWHSIYEEWIHMASLSGSFLNFTNNRIESINSKLKSVIKPYSSLALFVENFFVILESLQSARDKNLADGILKIPVGIPEELLTFRNILMPYPLKFILKEFNSIKHQKFTEDAPGNFCYISRGQKFPVNYNACSCISFNSMKLPCKHIIYVRRQMNMPLCDLELIHQRWTKNYVQKHQRVFSPEAKMETSIQISEKKQIKPKSRHEKFRLACILTTELADTISESSGKEFDNRIQILEELLKCWRNNKNVHLKSDEISNVAETVSADSDNTPDNNHSMFSANINDHNYTQANMEDRFETVSCDDEEIYDTLKDNDLAQANMEDSLETISCDDDEIYAILKEGSTSSSSDHQILKNNLSSTCREGSTSQATGMQSDNEILTSREKSKTSLAHQILSNNLSSTFREGSPLSSSEHPLPSNNLPSTVREESTSSAVHRMPNNNMTSIPAEESTSSAVQHIQNENLASTSKDESIKNIILPEPLRRRGHSKGFAKTVIGLPKKKICHPLPFNKLQIADKEKKILQWFVDIDIVSKALAGHKIDEKDVETKPENVSDGVLDDAVDISIIKKFFTEDGWLLLEQSLKMKRHLNIWLCKICKKQCKDSSVRCDGCLEWLHFNCTKAQIKKKEISFANTVKKKYKEFFGNFSAGTRTFKRISDKCT